MVTVSTNDAMSSVTQLKWFKKDALLKEPNQSLLEPSIIACSAKGWVTADHLFAHYHSTGAVFELLSLGADGIIWSYEPKPLVRDTNYSVSRTGPVDVRSLTLDPRVCVNFLAPFWAKGATYLLPQMMTVFLVEAMERSWSYSHFLERSWSYSHFFFFCSI